MNALDATTFASEGQQRSVALSLKIAQAYVLDQDQGQPGGAPPLMLLDDVFGELDATRRRALLRLLPAGTQKIITATSLDWAGAEELTGMVYEVEGAGVALVGGGGS